MSYTIQTHRELNLIISFGCISTMSIIGFSVLPIINQIMYYNQNGYYYNECALFYFKSFSKESFNICKSTDIHNIIILLSISVPLIISFYMIFRKTFTISTIKEVSINE